MGVEEFFRDPGGDGLCRTMTGLITGLITVKFENYKNGLISEATLRYYIP